MRCLAIGLLLCLRQHLVSNAICANGRQFQDWSADYRALSRGHWDSHRLFDPLWDNLAQLLPSASTPVVLAIDDTLCKKTGRKIPGVFTARDPLSPKFRPNFVSALRFLQASILLSPAPENPGPARALPVCFAWAPPAKKPKKNASAEDQQAYRKQQKQQALPRLAAQFILQARAQMDRRPALRHRCLVVVFDGSFTNKTLFQQPIPHRTVYIGRIRQDAKLCAPLPPSDGSRRGRQRLYGPPAPTPEQVRCDSSVPWSTIRCFVAGQLRDVQVKLVRPRFWRKAGARCPLQLVVLKACGYRLRQGAKRLYREPGFLVCTNPDLDLQPLVQAYLYRWEIECNHRDEKTLLGIGRAQVRNIGSVVRLPALQVASYSLLQLASLLSHGFQRGNAYLPLPKWNRKGNSARPSLSDMLNLLRDQLFALAATAVPLSNFDDFPACRTPIVEPPKMPFTAENLCTVAA